MDSLNVLIVENESSLLTQARKAYETSFQKLNNNSALNVQLNVIPKVGEQEKFVEDLVDKADNARIFNKPDIVADFIKEYLDKFKINVILLDFLINRSEEDNFVDNTSINTTTGALIISRIRESKYKNIPIVGYTQLKNEVQKLKIGNNSTLFQISKNIFTPNYFIENQGHLHNMLTEAIKYQNEIENQCDIVVVCALKKEIKPVIALLDMEGNEDNTETFAIGYIVNKQNTKLKVVAISKEQMGMAEAATLTTQMIEKYNPLYVVMTGVAGGIDIKGQKFLDILMPSYIHNWQSGKYKERTNDDIKEKVLHVFERDFNSVKTYIDDKTDLTINEKYLKKLPEHFLKSENFIGDFNEFNTQKYIKQTLMKLEKNRSEFEREIASLYEVEKKDLSDKITKLEKSRKKNKKVELEKLNDRYSNLAHKNLTIDFILEMVSKCACSIQKDGMVSGSAVVADGYIVKEHIGKRKVNGIDMEAYGVAYACKHHPKKPEAIILKAICDFADEKKNDIYQSAAAYVSAKAFYKLFTEVIDVEFQS